MWLSTILHLLFAGLVAWSGAIAGRVLVLPFWAGGLLGLIIYVLAVVGEWLGGRPETARSSLFGDDE